MDKEDRNEKMEESRANAVEGASTGAIPVNQAKTAVESVSHVIATSPVARSHEGMALSFLVYRASSILGWVGLRQADSVHQGAEEPCGFAGGFREYLGLQGSDQTPAHPYELPQPE